MKKRDLVSESVGTRIQAIRGELTLEEFAKKVGVSRQAVAKWERDESPPKVDHLEQIAKAFDVDAAFIAFGLSDPDKRDVVSRAILEKINLLTEDQKELILNNINALIAANGGRQNGGRRA
tara:strand:- start:1167 stop:1529 length:363 start_codon:yes stop_codon:yes gene_type:complete